MALAKQMKASTTTEDGETIRCRAVAAGGSQGGKQEAERQIEGEAKVVKGYILLFSPSFLYTCFLSGLVSLPAGERRGV